MDKPYNRDRIRGRHWIYFILLLCLTVMCWENQFNQIALAQGADDIPENAIRLRILANSDSIRDQQIKRNVRDEVVKMMNTWVDTLSAEPMTIEQARVVIHQHLPQFRTVVASVLERYGVSDSFTVELTETSFPTKIYGSKIYPAGNYEALRIAIGKGVGENWWCVLFPPLCFVDLISSEAVASPDNSDVSRPSIDASVTKSVPAEPEIRFFLWDLISSVLDWIGGLF